MTRTIARIAAAAAPLLLSPLAAGAQEPSPPPAAHELFAAGELEDYLRVLQVAGRAPAHPWSVRAFGPDEAARVAPPSGTPHPWAGRYGFRDEEGEAPRFGWVDPELRLIGNTGPPFGGHDGAVWAGRGATAAVRGGAWARIGPLSLTLAPVAFVAQNADFALQPVPAYVDPHTSPVRPGWVDRPQRFGDGAYARIDPGQSTLRLDVGPVAVGISTANQAWGPAADLPLILGDEAPGFVHLFTGTARPLSIGVGRLHGRLVWGRLEQSEFSPVPADSAARLATGLVVAFAPRWIEGLELGGARFFHNVWGGGPEAGDLLQPLEGLLKEGLSGADRAAVNQIASVFARWALPAAGFEAYGEYAREDHAFDLRDLTLEPDHNAGWMLGFRKVWERGDELVSLRTEVLDARPNHLHAHRPQTVFYTHGKVRQGHTHRGQVLGSPAAFVGAGSVVALDRYHPGGRWTLLWERAERRSDPSDPERSATTHAFGAEVLGFRGRLEWEAGLRAIRALDDGFGGEVGFDLNASLGARLTF